MFVVSVEEGLCLESQTGLNQCAVVLLGSLNPSVVVMVLKAAFSEGFGRP